ncbi:hypothetical protein HAX54_004022 [Datura stramonium]|uniref:FBD domain-containing protein n=1 Tax=Datura stramonium TaxID=4076 RepID=A0ABS8WUY3_DATST|nr:hypothetical protein [Datura stramonium]
MAKLSLSHRGYSGVPGENSIAKFFESFSALQHLHLDEDSIEVNVFHLFIFDVRFDHLKEVKLIDIIGSKPEMQIIKLLLAKSPVLVRMIVEAVSCSDDNGVGGGLRFDREGGGEQITGHVAHSLMQSNPAAGAIVLVSWEFTRENVTQGSNTIWLSWR